MTTGIFHSVEIQSISVNREGRQRKVLGDVADLAASIQRNGLIHPILIQRDSHELIAGERRLEAHRLLGWTHIMAQYEDEADPIELKILEYEENIRRQNLPWALEVAAVKGFHELKTQTEPAWTAADTAKVFGFDEDTIEEKLELGKAGAVNPKLLEIKDYSTARNVVRRVKSRANDAEAARASAGPFDPAEKPKQILNQSFIEWAPAYSGPKFTFIHCDFPYGINADNMNQGNTRTEFGQYSDDEAVYWELLTTFASHLDNFCADSAHLMFWYSMKFHTQTIAFLREQTNFIIDDFPFIWEKAGQGLLPDPQRGPRRVYETALFGRRGDRKIVGAVANAVSAPIGERVHMSQKPAPVLQHFFRMLVDENTAVLDPTCGSGTALAVAKQLKAELVLGLEIDPTFAERAQLLVDKVMI